MFIETFSPNTFVSTLFSNTSGLRSSLNVRDQFHIHTKQQTEDRPNWTTEERAPIDSKHSLTSTFHFTTKNDIFISFTL
jgi:hypothetical protein